MYIYINVIYIYTSSVRGRFAAPPSPCRYAAVIVSELGLGNYNGLLNIVQSQFLAILPKSSTTASDAGSDEQLQLSIDIQIDKYGPTTYCHDTYTNTCETTIFGPKISK